MSNGSDVIIFDVEGDSYLKFVINDNLYGGLSFINIKYVKEMDLEELKNGWGIFCSVVICLDVVDDKYFSNLLILLDIMELDLFKYFLLKFLIDFIKILE